MQMKEREEKLLRKQGFVTFSDGKERNSGKFIFTLLSYPSSGIANIFLNLTI